MNEKILELAYLRNQLASKQFDDKDATLMQEIVDKIFNSKSMFKDISLNAIENCKLDISKANFKAATQEIQLIHNFPFDAPEKWNADYFYKIELLSYLEQVENVSRIKKVIKLLGAL